MFSSTCTELGQDCLEICTKFLSTKEWNRCSRRHGVFCRLVQLTAGTALPTRGRQYVQWLEVSRELSFYAVGFLVSKEI